MEIALLRDLPVEAKHGMLKDSIHTVLQYQEELRRGFNGSVVVMGDANEEITVFEREYTELPEMG